MQRGKAPDAFSEQWSGEAGFEPPWKTAIALRIGSTRMKKWSEFLLMAAVGFALGAFSRGPVTAKLGALGATIVIAAVLSWIASRTQVKALEIQQRLVGGMKIKDLAIVDMTTGKITPPEKSEPETKET